MSTLLTLALLAAPAQLPPTTEAPPPVVEQAPAPEALTPAQPLPEEPAPAAPARPELPFAEQRPGGPGTELAPGTEARPGPVISGAALCVTRALSETGLSQHEAVLLCQAARSPEPVDCFVETDQFTFLDKVDILKLCSPTLSGPVRLYPQL